MTTTTGGAERYAEKLKRVMDAVALRKPDRVPIAFQATFWLARYGGISYRELMYNYDKAREITRRALLEFDPDQFYPVHATTLGPLSEAIGFKQIQWPGHGVGDNQPFQYIDREYMTADEYDDFLFDPTGFYLDKYLPRIATAFEGIDEMPKFAGLYYHGLVASMRQFSKPGVVKYQAALQKVAEEGNRFFQSMIEFHSEMQSLGFPLTNGGVTNAPFDYLGDYMRGAKGILTDMRRRPDKLLEALDKALVLLLRQALARAKASGNNFVFIPIHWAPDSFMSNDQFAKFWWPTFRKLLMGLIENDLIPVCLWESTCSKRLETIADIPRGKAIYWFERTDLVHAKEVLGDVVCLRGNVSPSLMTTGTPAEVDASCRHLIETVGKDGGFILDCAFGIPDETPLENVRAMYQSVRKYSA
jgi:uroporphyrinogen-III decarboxylase